MGSNAAEVPVLQNYINGKFVPVRSGKVLDNLNPATSQLLCQIPRSEAADVDDAVAAAKAAYPSWSQTPYENRAEFLDKIANALEAQQEKLALTESADCGKPLGTSRVIDIPRAIKNFRFFAGQLRFDSSDSHWMSDALNVTQRCPIGVAGLITPWNLPLYLLSWKVAPALAMGNTVVCKPSEVTPMTAGILAEVINTVGLPPGVFNLVHGLGPECGQALIAHKDVPLISFTGGTVTGRNVASTCAPMFKKVSLELGGKNAQLVFADCDWQNTIATAVRASFTNAGQVCLCGSRIFVERSVYDKFLTDFVAETQKMVVGDPATANIGSLTSKQHREKIESFVKLARDTAGAIIHCGGKRPDLPAPFSEGAFYLPTVISGLPTSHPCASQEIFGPVVTVHPFDTEEEAIAYANDSTYGLAGNLFTSNLQRATRVTRQWVTGMIWVNTWLHRDLRVPFGGVKESGLGVEGGLHSLEAYSNVKNICFKF